MLKYVSVYAVHIIYANTLYVVYLIWYILYNAFNIIDGAIKIYTKIFNNNYIIQLVVLYVTV